jgi:Mn-containing catalase
MKTAMQELIEYLEVRDRKFTYTYKKANELLEKEKEQIMAAKNDPTLKSPLEYYNQTYNQNK